MKDETLHEVIGTLTGLALHALIGGLIAGPIGAVAGIGFYVVKRGIGWAFNWLYRRYFSSSLEY